MYKSAKYKDIKDKVDHKLLLKIAKDVHELFLKYAPNLPEDISKNSPEEISHIVQKELIKCSILVSLLNSKTATTVAINNMMLADFGGEDQEVLLNQFLEEQQNAFREMYGEVVEKIKDKRSVYKDLFKNHRN